MDWFRGKEEVAKLTRKQEIERIDAMDHEDRREYLRELKGQLYEIKKLNFNGKGPDKTIAEDLEAEPTESNIVARFYDTYGGGDYEIWAYKPKRMRFRTLHIEGDPIYPDSQGKGPKDPIERLLTKGIDSMTPQAQGQLMAVALAQRLGVNPPQQANALPALPSDPLAQRKLQLYDLYISRGEVEKAEAILNGKSSSGHSKFEDIILAGAAERLGDGLFGGQKSEKAEEYEAIGKAGEAITRGITQGAKTVVEAWTGRPVGDEDDEDGPRENARQEYLCGNCRASLPVKEFDAGTLKNCPKCGVLLLRPGQAPPPPPQPAPMAPPPVPTPQLPPPQPVADRPVQIQNAPPPVQNLTKDELDFIYKAIPDIFLNRIRALNKEKVPRYFKLAQPLRKHRTPTGAAKFDVDYLMEKHSDRARVTLEMAKVGFEAMVGKYRPYIDEQIDRYEYAASEMRRLGKQFKKQYNATNKEITVLMNYRRLKMAWDYFQQPHALKWWKEYCAEVVVLLSKELKEMPPVEGPNTKIVQPEEEVIKDFEEEELEDADTGETEGTEGTPSKPVAPGPEGKPTDPQKP